MSRVALLASVALAVSAGHAFAQSMDSCAAITKAAPADMTVDAVKPLGGGA